MKKKIENKIIQENKELMEKEGIHIKITRRMSSLQR